jgi:hypothetical protein
MTPNIVIAMLLSGVLGVVGGLYGVPFGLIMIVGAGLGVVAAMMDGWV